MKEIIAIIRRSKADVTKQKLMAAGHSAFTEEKVLGRGKQAGLSYPTRQPDKPYEAGAGLPFLAKIMLTIFVNSEDAREVIDIINAANRTGEIGDGKIFVCPLAEAIRVRTDEIGYDALAVLKSKKELSGATA